MHQHILTNFRLLINLTIVCNFIVIQNKGTPKSYIFIYKNSSNFRSFKIVYKILNSSRTKKNYFNLSKYFQ